VFESLARFLLYKSESQFLMREDILDLPIERQQVNTIPQTGIAGIRYMFHEIDRQDLNHQPAYYYNTVKRIMDVTISATFILFVMSWLVPVIALLIKLTSKGPVFFIQKRTGYMGVEFNCFKFRTMFVNDEADTKQVSENDKRITRLGKFLRLTHLDETPQFFNVIAGDMSVVGPRPHMLYHTRQYSECIPYYNLRLEVHPGMTGMAQIKDYIGEISEERELRKRIQWDIYYMKNRSIGLDINILLSTLGSVLRKGLPFFLRKK
jgi:putative colanic acid biosynthesis UDP-glucose lipid carrier transferase